jgi:hypothetical protein
LYLEVTIEHYEQLQTAIQELLKAGSEIDIQLTIRLRGVSVDLNISESLIVINTLAVKRAQIRGGAWSTLGKQVEKPLMITLCRLFSVPEAHYELRGLTTQKREVDFFLVAPNGQRFRCEVKLMGKGNPESADAVIARDSQVFIADTLSELNREQLTLRHVKWVELRHPEGYGKFLQILQEFGIPSGNFQGSLSENLDRILPTIFEDAKTEEESPKLL